MKRTGWTRSNRPNEAELLALKDKLVAFAHAGWLVRQIGIVTEAIGQKIQIETGGQKNWYWTGDVGFSFDWLSIAAEHDGLRLAQQAQQRK